MERLLKDNSKVQEALSAEGRRLEEEKRRSSLWSDQVDELSLQVRSTDPKPPFFIPSSPEKAGLDAVIVETLADNDKLGKIL